MVLALAETVTGSIVLGVERFGHDGICRSCWYYKDKKKEMYALQPPSLLAWWQRHLSLQGP
jgi:hypothetical protein